MNAIQKLMSWIGLTPKSIGPAPSEKTVTVANGRQAVVDERGNFIRFK